MTLIMGKNCINEVLRFAPHRLIEVYTSQKKGDPLRNELEKAGVRIFEKQKFSLTDIVHSDSHQGFVAKVKERDNIAIKPFLKEMEGKEKSVVLMLDSIFDPQNLGAIIRSAECFGVDLVIYSKNRGSDITPVTTKTSSGATELMPISVVSNLAETLKTFQDGGYWSVAAELSDKSESVYELDFPDKTLLIMGSEGKGIQPLLSKRSDIHVSIPMCGQIDSLNVAQATAVLLSHFTAS